MRDKDVRKLSYMLDAYKVQVELAISDFQFIEKTIAGTNVRGSILGLKGVREFFVKYIKLIDEYNGPMDGAFLDKLRKDSYTVVVAQGGISDNRAIQDHVGGWAVVYLGNASDGGFGWRRQDKERKQFIVTEPAPSWWE